MRTHEDCLIFDSGRILQANGGVVGISAELEPTGGWDGGLFGPSDSPFTPDERKELAAHMIERWKKFAESA